MSKIKLNSGRYLDFNNLQAKDISLNDILHNLSKEQRFSNALNQSWSVLQHEILVTIMVSMDQGTKKECFCALHHDSSEAYMHDIATPLKDLLPEYKKLEGQLNRVISEKFNVWLTPMASIVKDKDRLAMQVEDLLFSDKPSNWNIIKNKDQIDHRILLYISMLKRFDIEEQKEYYMTLYNQFKPEEDEIYSR